MRTSTNRGGVEFEVSDFPIGTKLVLEYSGAESPDHCYLNVMGEDGSELELSLSYEDQLNLSDTGIEIQLSGVYISLEHKGWR